jgi:hypothetical protein
MYHGFARKTEIATCSANRRIQTSQLIKLLRTYSSFVREQVLWAQKATVSGEPD